MIYMYTYTQGKKTQTNTYVKSFLNNGLKPDP